MENTLSEFEKEIDRYTRKRMRQLRGDGEMSPEPMDPFIEEYTQKRIRELRLERELEEREVNLDNVLLGGYTVATMEAYSGKS
jgi:hypothetical protein